jgi:hypothetical protein
MGVSLRAWRTGMGVDNCQPPRPQWAGTYTYAYPLAYVGNSNFKLKFQFYGSSPGYLLRLMFVYTTSDIYLTRRNFQNWNLFNIFPWNYYMVSMALNSNKFVKNNINMLYAIWIVRKFTLFIVIIFEICILIGNLTNCSKGSTIFVYKIS